MDAIRSSLQMDLLIQRRGAGTRDVIASVSVIGAGWSCTASTISPLSSGPMTQVIDPTVKIWPGLRGGHGAWEGVTIWFAMNLARTPLPSASLSINLVGSLPRGMPTVVNESVEVHVRRPDGDTERKIQQLDRFGPSA